MNIKINPDLNLNDDAFKGFTSEQIKYVVIAAGVAIVTAGILFLLRIPSHLISYIIIIVAIPIASSGFQQSNGLSLIANILKKQRLKKSLYYSSTEGEAMEHAMKADRKAAMSARKIEKRGNKISMKQNGGKNLENQTSEE